jgi:hypothetical protein
MPKNHRGAITSQFTVIQIFTMRNNLAVTMRVLYRFSTPKVFLLHHQLIFGSDPLQSAQDLEFAKMVNSITHSR